MRDFSFRSWLLRPSKEVQTSPKLTCTRQVPGVTLYAKGVLMQGNSHYTPYRHRKRSLVEWWGAEVHIMHIGSAENVYATGKSGIFRFLAGNTQTFCVTSLTYYFALLAQFLLFLFYVVLWKITGILFERRMNNEQPPQNSLYCLTKYGLCYGLYLRRQTIC